MIFPILSYNSEVWWMYTKQDFKKWDSSPTEKKNLKLCKRYLEVNNKASNIACRAELGRLMSWRKNLRRINPSQISTESNFSQQFRIGWFTKLTMVQL